MLQTLSDGDFDVHVCHDISKNMKIAKMLFAKGANVNHQNKQGQTSLHYAMEYNYFDFGTWLADSQNGGGADDTVENQFQLTAYDGLGV